MGLTPFLRIVAGILLSISFQAAAPVRAESAYCCAVTSPSAHERVFSCPRGIQAKVRAGPGHRPAALIRLPGAFEAPTDIGTYFTADKEAAVVRGQFAEISHELIAMIRGRSPLIALSIQTPEGSSTTLVGEDSAHECLASQHSPELSSILSQTEISAVYASGAGAPARLVYDRLFGGR